MNKQSTNTTTRDTLEAIQQSVYAGYGCANRREYIDQTADDYGVPSDVAYAVADMLGPNEDFDGFITAMEDAGYMDF